MAELRVYVHDHASRLSECPMEIFFLKLFQRNDSLEDLKKIDETKFEPYFNLFSIFFVYR